MGIRSGCLSLFAPALSGRIPADTSDFWGRRRGVPMRGIRLSTSGGGAAGGVVSGAAGRAPKVLCGERYSPGDGAISVGGAGGFVLSRGPARMGYPVMCILAVRQGILPELGGGGARVRVFEP